MSELPFPYPPQETEYTPTPNPDPTIVRTAQPTPVANITTDLSNITPQVLTSMEYMQQLMIHMQTDQTRGGVQTSNLNTQNQQESTEPRQGQTHDPLPDFANKYFWTLGSAHMKEQREIIKRPNTRIQQPSTTSTVEAHMGAAEKGG